MVPFWTIVTLMLVVTLVLLLRPLLRPPTRSSPTMAEASVAAHRERLRALETQRRDGALSQEDYAEAREEVARAVVEDTRAGEDAQSRPSPAAVTAVVIALIVPLSSLALYGLLGNLDAIESIENPTPANAIASSAPRDHRDMARMIADLEARLAARPDDVRGWVLLARARISQDDFAGAAKAFDGAIATGADSADLLADYAEAAAIASEMNFSERARERIERALTLEPGHPKALMIGAISALQAGDPGLAIERWRSLLAMQPPGSSRARTLEDLIARTESGMSGDESANAKPAHLRVSVDIDPALAATLSGNERVFVFAREPQGPPMPLAVVRLAASELPATVVLDDSTAMMPSRTLSAASKVQIGARVSMSGNATPSSGDLEGSSEPLDPKRTDVIEIRIDRRRP